MEYQNHWLNFSLVPENFTNSSTFEVSLDYEEDPCDYKKHPWLETKFILISLCGTSVAALGILGNFITTIVLTRPSMRSPNNLYLTFLSIFDNLLLIAAILLYSFEYIYEYYDSLTIYELWITYIKYVFALSHIAQTGSVYLTVSVTFERYLAVLFPKRARALCTQNRAGLTIVIVIAFSILFNSTKYFELDVIDYPNCTGFATRQLLPSSLLMNQLYTTVHSFWLTQMIMVFIPFIVLFFVNFAIAWKIRRSLKRLSWIQQGQKKNELKQKSRDATQVLLVIVFVFLICNSWGFVLTLMENIYGENNLRTWWPKFYTFSREAVNFLAIVNSSINFVIYCIFGKDFRQELMSICKCTAVPLEDLFAAEEFVECGDFHKSTVLLRTVSMLRQAQIARGRRASLKKSPRKSCKKQNGSASYVGVQLYSNAEYTATNDLSRTNSRNQHKVNHRGGHDYNENYDQKSGQCSNGPVKRGSLFANGSILPSSTLNGYGRDCDSVERPRSKRISEDEDSLLPILLGEFLSGSRTVEQSDYDDVFRELEEDWV